jgi:hypothetical protein
MHMVITTADHFYLYVECFEAYYGNLLQSDKILFYM